jgi:hypothetical protein
VRHRADSHVNCPQLGLERAVHVSVEVHGTGLRHRACAIDDIEVRRATREHLAVVRDELPLTRIRDRRYVGASVAEEYLIGLGEHVELDRIADVHAQAVEETLRAKEAPVRPQRIDWSEGGLLTAKREYLRATYGRYSFDICAAPFGKDYFFSWWLTKRRSESALLMGCGAMIGLLLVLTLLVKFVGYIGGFLLFIVALGTAWTLLSNGAIAGAEVVDDVLLALPVVGPLYTRFIRPATYFSEDSRLVFEEAVHTIVQQQVESFLKTKGARTLAPEETRPQSRPLFR